MKKVFALILCCALLVVMPVGCKKKAAEKAEWTDSVISADLLKNDHLYNLAHCGKFSSIADLKITEKVEKSDTVSLSVTAKAVSPRAEAQLVADMTYTLTNNQWKLKDIRLTQTAAPTDAPDKESVRMEIDNYLAHNMTSQEQKKPIALAIHGEERHELTIKTSDVAWDMSYEKGSTTAKLTAALNNNDVAFIGYYKLTFDESKGWIIESEKQENGQHYPVLYLDTLELKNTDKK
ncbi:MAG: hypothetical protein IJB36_05225 [Clostridia bacterium]|nr:hypothetical protein [Clostridia bacterium]